MKTKITLNGTPAEIKAYETANGWRCEVVWMLQWVHGASVLGRGDNAELAQADFMRRAEDDGHEVVIRPIAAPVTQENPEQEQQATADVAPLPVKGSRLVVAGHAGSVFKVTAIQPGFSAPYHVEALVLRNGAPHVLHSDAGPGDYRFATPAEIESAEARESDPWGWAESAGYFGTATA